ncbi:MAG: sigma-70 family RNA polymerase sigma factor [Planctomycetes bacterium]|nr:sigma-70 family RNA polymerase sigma factor [Planctomycetota bacterium]
MFETSHSLLDRLRRGPDESGWPRMVHFYTPLLRSWVKRAGLRDTDADDLVQEVLAVVVRRLPEFERRARVGAFRRWLRCITLNCLRDFWRRNRNRTRAIGHEEFAHVLGQLEDPNSALSQLWDREYDEQILGRLLELVRPRFEEKTWQAFRLVALDGMPVDQVAAELGISANAVFIAKSRVLHLLRREGKCFLE